MANVLGTLFGEIADAIREKSGEGGTMKPAEFPAKITAIPTGGGAVEGVATVYFCNYDGSALFSRQVFIGDDCPSPVTQNKLETPTRESTAQYDYTFNGWSLTEGGSASTSALKSITADRTVYAAYSSAVRYYTISFYDGDTLLKAEQYAYGTTPSYEPLKDEFTFVGWEPALVPVTGDASYYAQWTELIEFATASWAQIAQIAESGRAAEYFSLGDKKSVSFAFGSQRTIDFQIVGFGMDSLSDGSGTAGITLIATKGLQYTVTSATMSLTLTGFPDFTWESSGLRTYLANTMYNALPSDLRSVIKQVNKKIQITRNPFTHKYVDDYLWLPSWGELGLPYSNTTTMEEGTTKYPIFTNDASRIFGDLSSSTTWYNVRNSYGKGSIANSSLGSVTQKGVSGDYGKATSFLFGFCI